MSSDMWIHSVLSSVSLYPSLITLYLHAYQQLILKSTIQEISYLGFPSIITGVGAGCVLSEKELDMAGLNMDT